MSRPKKNLCILILSLLCILVITSLAGLIPSLPSPALQAAAKVCLNLLNGLAALIAMRLSGTKVKLDLTDRLQYLTGIVLALMLAGVVCVLPTLFGGSLVGGPIPFSIPVLVCSFLFYLLIVGPVEELIFRVYLQDTFLSFFPNHPGAGVVLQALLFGFWHVINGSLVQVPFAFCIGLIFGFAKLRLKHCGYVGVSLAHGLYDFLCTLTAMLLV